MKLRNLFRRDLGRWVPGGVLAWPVAALALALALTSGWAILASADDELPDGTVMRVDGNTMTEDELEERLSILSALYGVVRPQDGEKLEQFRRDAAKSMALSTLLEEEAKARDVVISNKQAEAELAKVISERLGGDRDKFVTHLGTAGISENDVLEEIARTMATSRLFAEITKDVDQATSEDARKEFDARRAEMTTPEKRRLGNIVVATEADAQTVRRQLDTGVAFATVAQQSSLDQSTRDTGGNLGLRAATELETAFAEAAFSAAKGTVFGPVETRYGWNVGTVIDVVPGTPLSFEAVEATLISAITSREQLAVWRDWLTGLLQEADVDYADEYQPEDETAPDTTDVPGGEKGDEQP